VIIWRWEYWFHNDLHSSGKKFLGSDPESFVENGDDLPVDVLFSIFVTTAPVLVTLPVSFDGPVLGLTFFGAVGPLLATAAQFSGQSAKLKAVGAVPDDGLFFLLINPLLKQSLNYLLKQVFSH